MTAERPVADRLREPDLVEVADGVYAVVQFDGGWCLSNSGIIAGPERTVVVDTMATARRAKHLRALVDKASRSGSAGLTVVNTHHHGDHTFGNFAFAEDATLVASELTARNMELMGLRIQGFWPEAEWGETTVALPDVTYADRYTLDDGAREIELTFVGPAHTQDDSVVHLPAEGVLFAGDLVFNGGTPFCLMGSISGSLRAVERLRALGARVIVPGHGPVGGPELLDAAEDYLRWVQRLAVEGIEARLDPIDLARSSRLGRFEHLRETERLVANLTRAYFELGGGAEGAPLDVPQAFADMTAYLGHAPVCHA